MRTPLVLAATLVLCGCGAKSREPASLRIAVIPKGTTHEFWKAVHAGAIKAGEELGVTVEWKGPLQESDREEQIKVIENFVTRGVSGIALAPLDDAALVQPVANAARAGIPVVIFDSDLSGGDYVSFVATDNYRGGQLAGDELARRLGGTGNVVLLRYAVGSASTTNREQGFLDAIAKHPGITVVSDNQYAGATTETAFQAAENILASRKTAAGLGIDGIFCPNESSTFGTLRALVDGGHAGKVHLIGFDSSPKFVEAINAGQMDGMVLQNPVNMGYLAVKTLVSHLRGQPVEKRIDTGATLVTKDNIADPAVAELVSPKLAP
ncbi:MAG: substrate-binding domain-containing protein [Gemmatimonadales bacterium]